MIDVKKSHFFILLIVLASFSFGWWEVRPAITRSNCVDWALQKATYNDSSKEYDQDVYDDYYARCIHKHGL